MSANNINFERKRPCTGCGACAAVCTHNAIKFDFVNGFYKPTIDMLKCINCGLCKTVCYSHNNIEKQDKIIAGYSGVHSSKKILKKCASGGATYSISQFLLDNDYIVIGCGYNINSHTSEHIIINDKNKIGLISGSKYFQSNTFKIFETLNNMDRQSKMVLFGTPCQIYGFKKFFEIKKFNMDNIYFIELFCHGVTSPIIWKKYLESKAYYRNITNIIFRNKHYGWHIPCNTFVLSSGKQIHTKRRGDKFFDIFYSTKILNESCYSCECKKTFGVADIRIGDFWGERYRSNKTGISCILSLTEKGDTLIKSLNDFENSAADIDEILREQSYLRDHNIDTHIRDKILFGINNNNFKKIFKSFNSQFTKTQIFKKIICDSLSNLKNKILKK